jgi:purine-binding chemotaxis protein CheW
MTAHLCVALGPEHYGLAVEHVREVAELGTIVPVPGAGTRVIGVRHLQGEILPVVRLRDFLGATGGEPHRIVVVHDGDCVAGLAVDRADGVEELAEPDAPGDPLTRGAVLHGGAIFGILDVPAILGAIRTG